MARTVTLQGVCTSEIGIHKEPHYKGDQGITEFVECRSRWRLWRGPAAHGKPRNVPNVYLADAAPFVSGRTQNITWSILAMC
jgi:hypothetical protein